MVIQLHESNGDEAPLAGRCSEVCPLRREECVQIDDRGSAGCGGEGEGDRVHARRPANDGPPAAFEYI